MPDEISTLSQTMQFALLVVVLIGVVCIGRSAKHMGRAAFLLVLALGLVVWHIYAHPDWVLQFKEFIDNAGWRTRYD
jgi:hypothetical protein